MNVQHHTHTETGWNRLLNAVVLFLLILGMITPSSVLAAPAAPARVAVDAGQPQFVPPSPNLKEKIKQGKVKLPRHMTDPAWAASVGIEGASTKAPLGAPAPQAAPLTGTVRMLAVAVDFSDKVHTVTANFFDSLLFATPVAGPGSMRDYYSEISYGQIDFVTVNLPSALGWQRAPQTYAYYVNHNYGESAYPQNAQKLAEDVFAAIDSVVDFSQYDNNGDGVAEPVVIIHAGQGGEKTGNLDDLWSFSWGTPTAVKRDGVWVYKFTVQPEYASVVTATTSDQTMGVYAHEVAHGFFGVPDTYDTDYSSGGVGNFDLMAGGSWGGPNGGDVPTWPSAWIRKEMGIVTPVSIAANVTGRSIAQVYNNVVDPVLKLSSAALGPQEYFLVENRQQAAGTYDQYLPASGLLIWHIDEAMTSNKGECYAVPQSGCSDTAHYRVALMQADGLFDMEKNVNRGDAGDPYPGSTNNRNWATSTVPETSSYYAAGETCINVTNISNAAATMTADLRVTCNAANTPPVAVDDSYVTAKNVAVTIAMPGVLNNDTDLDWNQLTASRVTDPAHGALTFNANGSFTYTPAGNFTGTDSFTYKINDGLADSNDATVTISVLDTGMLATTADQTRCMTVIGTDPTTAPYLTMSACVGTPQQLWTHDSVSGQWRTALNPNYCLAANSISLTRLNLRQCSDSRALTIEPNPTEAGSWRVVGTTYVIDLATWLWGSPGVLYPTLSPQANYSGEKLTWLPGPTVNTAPAAVNDTYATNEDTALTIAAPGVLSNDTDGENNSLTAVKVSDPAHGTLTLNANGSFTYTPAANWNGSDSFTYRANDGSLNSNIATVSFTVNPVNDAPAAVNDSYSTNEDTPLTTAAPGVLGNDSDIDSAALTAVIVSEPAHGVLTLNANGSFTYNPAVNWSGSDTFTYKANDGTLDSNVATVSITVNPVNDAPIANDQSATTAEDTANTITLTGSDVEGSTLAYTVVTGPAHGVLSGTAPNLTYTPALNYHGSDSFTFKVNDGTLDSSTATVSITVTPVNDAPAASADSYVTDQDTVLVTDAAHGVLANDTDIDSSGLTAIQVSGPAHGSLVLNADGSFTYTPAAGFQGDDSFTYKASDGSLDSNVVTVSLTVRHVNHAPVAQDQLITTNQDTPAALTLLATDADSDPLTYTVVSGPSHGTLSGTDASLTYTPQVGYSGSDSFTFKANDGTADSNTATISITVVRINHAPVAEGQSVTAAEDTARAIILTGSDAEGSALAFTVLDSPAHGTLSGTAPSLTYTPAGNYNGPDSFTFKVNDGELDSSPATVSITVTPVNDAPVAQADSYSTDEDTALTIDAAQGVLANDTDVDSSALVAVKVAGPQYGALALNADGSFAYTPAANWNGTDSFTYKANDGSLESNIVTVTITVNAVNDAPIAANDSYTTERNQPLTVAAPGVLGNDSDIDGGALTAVLVNGPQTGTLALNANGSFTYTPAADFNGTDSFTYKVNDGQSDSNEATVTIGVNATNRPPAAANDSYTTDEDTVLAVDAANGVLSNDTDADHNSLTAEKLSDPANGTLVFNTDGSFTYTPNANWNGTDTFTYQASDGTASSNVATVTITIRSVNDAPVAQGQSITTTQDTPVSIILIATDIDSNTLTYTVSAPAHGVLSGTAPNLTYTPNAGYSGSDNFTFSANDGTTDSNPAAVSITVTHVNHAPQAAADSYSTAEDTILTVNAAQGLLTNDTDPDGDSLTAVQASSPAHGTLTFYASGAFSYTPDANWYGTDSFTYKVSDSALDSSTATVAITVSAVNDAPVAYPQSVTTTQGTAKAITLTATDVEGSTLTYIILNGPAHGTLSGTAPALTYTSDTGYAGSDSFTFKANDGTLDSNIAAVSITVIGTNHAPVALNDAYSTKANTAVTIVAPGVLGNDTDADGNPLTAVKVSGPSHGTLTLNPNGSFLYTPANGYVGSDSFTYKANDGAVDSNLATVTITITFKFTGFLQPVDNLPVENTVKAGQSIPVKFSLNGNMGLAIFGPGSPSSKQVTCPGSSTPVDAIETTTNSNSGLTYNSVSDQYTYVWKTEKGWAGSCRLLTVAFVDGTSSSALFKFNK